MELRRLLVLGLAFGLLSAGLLHGETPTTRPAGSSNNKKEKDGEEPLSPAVQKAVETLEAEFMAAAKDLSKGKLRENSDYFVKTKEEVTQEQIIAALGRKLTKLPACDAYIKWQLLSAVKGEFDETNVKPVLNAYQRSPNPPPFIGANPELQRQMDRTIKEAKDDESRKKIEAGYNEELRKFNLIATPVLQYRGGLYARLPKSAPVFYSAFADIKDRIDKGHVPSEFARLVVVDVQSWAAGTDKRAQIGNVVSMAQGLINYKGPKVYLSYNIPPKKTAYQINSTVPQVDPKLIKSMVDSLNAMFK